MPKHFKNYQKSKIKKKNPESIQKKATLYLRELQFEWLLISHQKPMEATRKLYIFNVLGFGVKVGERTINPEFYI